MHLPTEPYYYTILAHFVFLLLCSDGSWVTILSPLATAK